MHQEHDLPPLFHDAMEMNRFPDQSLPPSPSLGHAMEVESLTSPNLPISPSFYSECPSPLSFFSNVECEYPFSISPSEVFRNDIMLKYLHQRQMEKLWSVKDCDDQGVVLKRGRNDFICKPDGLSQMGGLYDQVKTLNVKVAMTVKTNVIETFLKTLTLPYVPLDNGLRIQVLPYMSSLSRCKKHQMAAFIRQSGLLVVWHDDPEMIIGSAESIEQQLVQLLWKNQVAMSEKELSSAEPSFVIGECEGPAGDIPSPEGSQPKRGTMLYQPVLTALTATLSIFCIGVGWRQVAMEIKVDSSMTRLALLAVVPAQIWLGWFFFHTLVNGLAQMIGPVNQVTANSRSYSGVKTSRLVRDTLPHVTIQCPVYKEGLWTVIDPTMVSLRAAISTYEMQGGSANIFVNDDGMQLLSSDKAEERRNYYEEHSVGWVGRPKHDPRAENPFVRPGKFKKASNMNYAMQVSARVEAKLAMITRSEDWSELDEDQAYRNALAAVIDDDSGRTWAEGDIRIGDYILIIDSDTRVPSDCLLDAVSEMEESPQVAIIQFSSGVMNVTTSFFEKGITFFTNLVYTAIQFAVANGDVAPFVGHNAILRWSALQDVSYEQDGAEKYWSEETVSEDFDMALRLQSKGYELRFSTVYNDQFQEGVSLAVYDELSRWEKYAYGCSELIFHPFRYWPTCGPVTPLFRHFITSNMSLMSKITVLSYIGTYYAIGSAWLLTVLNYFLVGWFNGYLDHYYTDSFRIYFSVVVVFQALGTVSLSVLRYRTTDCSLVGSFLENLKWLPLLTIFLGGISIHVSQAIASHMFSIDMTWGATAKEETRTTFFNEIPTIFRKFKFTFAFCVLMLACMVVLAGVGPLGGLVPHSYHITDFTAIWPLSTVVAFHFLMPLVLNPGLMQFTF